MISVGVLFDDNDSNDNQIEESRDLFAMSRRRGRLPDQRHGRCTLPRCRKCSWHRRVTEHGHTKSSQREAPETGVQEEIVKHMGTQGKEATERPLCSE